MSEQPDLTPDELARQARQHLDGLRNSGVEWVPREAPAPITPGGGPSLFSELEEAAPAVPDVESRRRELTVLAERVAGCTRCPELASSRTQTVFGVGPLEPDLCFLGEAPGADEDRTGEPFVGAAGQLLNRIIAACGMKREEVFICNILRCLHGFTKVLTEDGWLQIQRIVARRYPGKVAAVDESGRVVWAKITAYHRTPRLGRNLVKLRLDSARRGTRPAGGVFTDDHEVLTQHGYKRICELDPATDRIQSGTSQPALAVRQALVGMLLGDARFNRKTNSFSASHSPAQSDYLYHKAKICGVPDSAVRFVSAFHARRGATYQRFAFHHKATPFFRRFGATFYPAGRKVISPEALREFGAISLAYLFMDDGYLRIRPGRAPSAEIATCCFTPEEVGLLINKIGELGIRGYTRPKDRYPRIHFDAANTSELSRLIAPHVLESMNYKLMSEHRSIGKTLVEYAVEPFFDTFTVEQAAPVYTRSCNTVYCLSVERFENFVTHSGVVHNCRPPANRPPRPAESDNCREWLDQTLDLVRPKFICCLGATAAQNLLRTKTPIGKMRGKFYEYRGIPVLCTYHPASLLPSRSPEKKKDVWEDMKLLLQRMGKPIPKPGGKG